MPEHELPANKLTALWSVLFIASIATFVQAFLILKLVLLGLFLFTAVVDALLRERRLFYPQLIWFYAIIGIVGATWGLIGLWRPGNYLMGVTDALRLYLAWSLAYVLIFSLFRAVLSLRTLHMGLLVGATLICLVNAIGVADQLLGWGLIGTEVREEMYLTIGILDGYARINSINIGSLFLIVPYLLALQFFPEERPVHPRFTRVALILCLALVAASGRRGLWLVVLISPFTILAVSLLTGAFRLTTKRRRWALGVCCAAVVVGPLVAQSVPGVRDLGPFEHVASAFSAEDERSIQSGYLLAGWFRTPFIGSGFGAYAGYERNELRPWTYELTYHRMLFNLGLIGTTVLVGLFAFYFTSVLHAARRAPDLAQPVTALLVGLLSLLIGAYSNPYLGSFDYLLLLGLLPYLATRPGAGDGAA